MPVTMHLTALRAIQDCLQIADKCAVTGFPLQDSRPALLAYAGKQFVELVQLLRQSGRRAL
jgi:hypothetical protein